MTDYRPSYINLICHIKWVPVPLKQGGLMRAGTENYALGVAWRYWGTASHIFGQEREPARRSAVNVFLIESIT